jgi:hypothetical protein
MRKVSRLDVLRYELEVGFSKLARRPWEPGERDFEFLLEELPKYHDGPRNSPTHFYAALADENLEWFEEEVPVGELVMGPGDEGLHAQVATEAEGYIHRFVKLVQENYHDDECFKSHFRDGPIRYPLVPCVFADYKEVMHYLGPTRGDYGGVYRIQDGYHRTFQMIARGRERIPAFVGRCKEGSLWRGNFSYLRFKNGRWMPEGSEK